MSQYVRKIKNVITEGGMLWQKNQQHFGLEKVKDRILEYLAVKTVTNSLKAPIICFAGPPGVGKTSLAKSIARALDRKFVKMALFLMAIQEILLKQNS